MLEELERRNYAPSTIRAYLRTVEHFARYFRCPPDRLGTEHIRQYQAAMFRTWKLSPNTVTQRLAALRFLYIQVLKEAGASLRRPIRRRCCGYRRSSVKRRWGGLSMRQSPRSIAFC
jgi:integrase/recombinase XerD